MKPPDNNHPGKTAPIQTQVELAAQLGLSFVTINRALNGSHRVNDNTRQRVLDAVARLGYQKNQLASGLVRRRSNLLGMVICGSQYSFFGQVALGAQVKARELGYHILLADSEFDPTNERDAIHSLLSVRIAGLILQPVPGRNNPEFYQELKRKKLPILTLVCRNPDISPFFLDSDNSGGMVAAVRHLVSLGHRRIAYLGGPLVQSDAQERHAGYCQGCHSLNLATATELIVNLPTYEVTANLVAEAVKRLQVNGGPFTALLTATDAIAMLAINHLRECGIRIPQDLSVMGFTNMPECIFSSVPLTTMDQQPRLMGARAVEILIGLLDADHRPLSGNVRTPTMLISRASTASLSSNVFNVLRH